MKMTDIEVGREYAAGPPQRATIHRTRVRVLRTGIHRKVFTGWRYQTSDRADGVEVRVLTRWGKEIPEAEQHTETIPSSHILRPWEEHAKTAAAVRKAEAEAKAERQAQEAKRNELVAEIESRLGYELKLVQRYTEVRLTVDEAADLLNWSDQ